MAWCGGPAGVEEQGIGTRGSPRNLGDPAVSTRNWPEAARPKQPQAPGRRRALLGETNTGATSGTAKRRKRSAAGRAAGSRSVLIVPTKRGNAAHSDPGEGRGRRVMEPLEGNMAGASESGNRVNTTTTTDSGAGEASAADGIHFPGPPHRPRLAVTRRTCRPARTGPRAWTDRRRTDYAVEPGEQPASRCWTGPSPARTGHRRCGGCTFRRGRVTRPGRSGIPTFEDKVLQRAVVMVLEPIYEQDFLDCSYGFRPGRSAHQALE